VEPIHEKKRSKKSRWTVPLIIISTILSELYQIHKCCPTPKAFEFDVKILEIVRGIPFSFWNCHVFLPNGRHISQFCTKSGTCLVLFETFRANPVNILTNRMRSILLTFVKGLTNEI
jgi:hypothetical protein